MALAGWKTLLDGAPWFRGAGNYPIAAYSEFVPPPREGILPYGLPGASLFSEEDAYGWPVTEFEETLEIRPGLAHVGDRLIHALACLGRGQPTHGLSRRKLEGNPAWPTELATGAGKLHHERYVTLLPLALSKTQDDKGRVRWTVFGGSEQGPARAFWRSFFVNPRRQAPAGQGEDFIRRLLHAAYGEPLNRLTDLRKAGFRILPLGDDLDPPFRGEGPLPDWTEPYLLAKRQPMQSVRYLLTFRPFAALPDPVRTAYLSGELHLIPCPGSLLFWGDQGMRPLFEGLPFAYQVPLLHLFGRSESLLGMRIPQSGVMHEHHPDHPVPDDPHLPIRNTYKRSHRWERLHRHQDELAVGANEDKLAHVLFSTDEKELGLYGKPMARNVQLWDSHHRLLLDGPRAARQDIRRAAQRIAEGGLFGYRFLFPPLRVGRHEIYWHRPLVAYAEADGRPALLHDAPLGYLTAYPAAGPKLERPIELWPRLLQREPYLEALHLFHHPKDPQPHRTALNARMLLEASHLAGHPLSRSLASRMLCGHSGHSVDQWLESLPKLASDPARGQRLVEEIEQSLEPLDTASGKRQPSNGRNKQGASTPRSKAVSHTFQHTAKRSFEVAYWKTIADLSEGRFKNKSNADCIRDEATRKHLTHYHRDLEALGDYLLEYHCQLVKKAGMEGKAVVGDLPFQWQTDFDFSWMGGWLHNQDGHAHERNLIIVIPGRDRGRAVIMADHYDTAYMVDRYDPTYGGDGSRLAAAGADDNHSATAALMLAAPVFLQMSKEGQLGCDVWLVHLTGEEFPSDCLGARHLSQLIVEGCVKARLSGGKMKDLSKVRIQGVYDLDMVAHNNDRERDVFQIAPGTTRQSLWLAEQAHLATEAWNAGTAVWNRKPARQGKGRSRRSSATNQIPDVAEHLPVRGEVRLTINPRSTLYNTDGQIFSDAGIPIVLFMENYDINRSGYHDTHDTMKNIDLDYGSAVAAITIESVARAACSKAP
jgi:hypothetical protein